MVIDLTMGMSSMQGFLVIPHGDSDCDMELSLNELRVYGWPLVSKAKDDRRQH